VFGEKMVKSIYMIESVEKCEQSYFKYNTIKSMFGVYFSK